MFSRKNSKVQIDDKTKKESNQKKRIASKKPSRLATRVLVTVVSKLAVLLLGIGHHAEPSSCSHHGMSLANFKID